MTTNADLQKRREAAVPRGVATAHPVFAAKAEGAEIWDVEGKRYIDFVGGIGVQNTGHRHPAVVEAVKAQLDQAMHTAFQVNAYESYIQLAEELNALAPVEGPAKTIFFTTGAEAVENAIKIARYATRRSAVISFTGGFHGRTLYATGLTGKVVPYRAGFGPLPSDIYRLPFPMGSHGMTAEKSLETLDWLFKTEVEPARVAALIIEPVQGEGGFYVAPPDFLRTLKNICERHGILFIADEIQSGFGRTGKLFAIEHSGLKPDFITTAKSLAGGMPLSGVIGRAALMDAPEPGGLGGTYAGNPLACAAGLAVLKIIKEEKILEKSTALGEKLKGRLDELSRRNDLLPIGEIRGLGSMVAFDILKARGTDEPDPDATRRLMAAARERGLILLTCGLYGNGVRILVPINARAAIIDEGLKILEDSLRAAVAG
ncbi:MAG: 4-aminobutyrate--2-oxoglutarate transaminase [Alphaproteobacteria bacterium]|nr:4-aminobutyrate--2-oxoglutarate transaminase [Alphaproteobacteria bacterium]